MNSFLDAVARTVNPSTSPVGVNLLEATHKAGIRYPIPFQMHDSCDLPEPYTVREGDR